MARTIIETYDGKIWAENQAGAAPYSASLCRCLKVLTADVPQLYLTDAANEKRTRLLGFERMSCAPVKPAK